MTNPTPNPKTNQDNTMPVRIWAYDSVPANWIDMPHSQATEYLRHDIAEKLAAALEEVAAYDGPVNIALAQIVADAREALAKWKAVK